MGKLYSYDAKATDPEHGDFLFWSLDEAPLGMSIAAARGSVRWLPTEDQIGLQHVALRVRDPLGAAAGQIYDGHASAWSAYASANA